MDPGKARDLISVYYKNETEDDTGNPVVDLELQGKFWATVTFVTKTLSFSGFETSYIGDKLIPIPVVRVLFNTKREFDFSRVEFHRSNGDVYIPREPGIRAGGTGGSRISYNCRFIVPRNRHV